MFVKDKSRLNIIICLTALISLLVLLLSSCSNNLATNFPSIVSTEIAIPSPVTLLPTSGTDDAAVVAHSTLGTIQYLQYSYSLIHNYDFDSCIFNPYICPDVYYALLSDVHDWLYVQMNETSWLQFGFDSDYQIEPSEINNDCNVSQNAENPILIGITCPNVGEYVLQFDIKDTKQDVVYPLILNVVSVPTLTPIVPAIPLELSIEEYELAQHPESDTGFFKPITGTASEILAQHATERGQVIAGLQLVHLENGQQIQAEMTPQPIQSTGSSNAGQVINITITQNGQIIFTKQAPVLTNDSFHGLWSFGNHWFAEIENLNEQSFRSHTKGEIFRDGQSLNELNDYTESFGFQILHGKPFYFFEKFGRVGISYDGQDTHLGYDRVLHYGCCSMGVLNPKIYENMVGFFAVRGDKWYYVEIGVFQ